MSLIGIWHCGLRESYSEEAVCFKSGLQGKSTDRTICMVVHIAYT